MNNPSLPSTDPGSYEIESPVGGLIRIAVTPYESDGFSVESDREVVRRFFDEQGYAVLRHVIPPGPCAAVLDAFRAEVKPSRDFFIRHRSGMPERHIFTDHGFMKFPIMNPHELSSKRYGALRTAVLNVLTDRRLQTVIADILGGRPKLVHTMLFEGNQVTWPHRDSSYIDASQPGRMVAAWVALEEIKPGAGRFFVYPRSHKLDLPLQQFDPNSDDYVASVRERLKTYPFPCVAPALAAGDVMLWSNEVIHGSLCTQQPQFSRACVTGHFIDASDHLLGSTRRPSPGKLKTVNGLNVHFRADQDVLSNRLLVSIKGRYPALYRLLRRLAH